MASRREWLRNGLIAAGGVAAGFGATKLPKLWGPDRLPIEGGYAPAGDASAWSTRGGVRTIWHVPTSKPWVALTFDDGPAPDWTPQVLDTLDRLAAPATFFIVGDNLRKHGNLVRGRYEQHELGNHTWQHKELAQRDFAEVRDQVLRTHDEIIAFSGKAPVLLRPPWGHVGGTTLTVADELGYDLVMWSQRMREDLYEDNPPGIVKHTIDELRPGAIILAHDTGSPNRIVAINQLEPIINGLRDKGFELVTVSKLLSAV